MDLLKHCDLVVIVLFGLVWLPTVTRSAPAQALPFVPRFALVNGILCFYGILVFGTFHVFSDHHRWFAGFVFSMLGCLFFALLLIVTTPKELRRVRIQHGSNPSQTIEPEKGLRR